MISRRKWLQSLGIAFGATLAPKAYPVAGSERETPKQNSSHAGLSLSEYQPKSMLHVRETRVERPRFPLSTSTPTSVFLQNQNTASTSGPSALISALPEELLPSWTAKNIRSMVNLTGGFGNGLTDVISKYDQRFPIAFTALPNLLTPGSWNQTILVFRLKPLKLRIARGQGAQDPQDARTLSARKHHDRRLRQGGR